MRQNQSAFREKELKDSIWNRQMACLLSTLEDHRGGGILALRFIQITHQRNRLDGIVHWWSCISCHTRDFLRSGLPLFEARILAAGALYGITMEKDIHVMQIYYWS